ncbi:hypothetical protein OPV22_008719 [Ensete ventricosum]|uniref:Uncharacterized protein n=1 Tax=Ensete ventricosum TaxID=4639 RepID=A0AAV8RHN6_ENSVE|nr:hypothetical protein OPV22_008719 [Ensete ventricosum]
MATSYGSAPFVSGHLCGACERLLRRFVSLVPGRSSLPSHSSERGLDDVGEHIVPRLSRHQHIWYGWRIYHRSLSAYTSAGPLPIAAQSLQMYSFFIPHVFTLSFEDQSATWNLLDLTHDFAIWNQKGLHMNFQLKLCGKSAGSTLSYSTKGMTKNKKLDSVQIKAGLASPATAIIQMPSTLEWN